MLISIRTCLRNAPRLFEIVNDNLVDQCNQMNILDSSSSILSLNLNPDVYIQSQVSIKVKWWKELLCDSQLSLMWLLWKDHYTVEESGHSRKAQISSGRSRYRADITSLHNLGLCIITSSNQRNSKIFCNCSNQWNTSHSNATYVTLWKPPDPPSDLEL